MPKKLQTKKAVEAIDTSDLDEDVSLNPLDHLSGVERECYEIGLALRNMSMEPDNIYDIKLGGAGGRVVIDCKVGNTQIVFGKSLIDALSKLA